MSDPHHESRTRLQEGGRLVIPARYRKALSLTTGEELVLRIQDNELRVVPASQALARARRLVKKHVRRKTLTAELIAERRKQASEE